MQASAQNVVSISIVCRHFLPPIFCLPSSPPDFSRSRHDERFAGSSYENGIAKNI